MKLFFFSEEKLNIFLNESYFKSFDNLNEKNIKVLIKRIINNIKNNYNINITGYYDIKVYYNKKVGAYIKFNKIDDYISNNKLLDARITIYKNCEFLFRTKDYFIINKFKKIYYDQDYFYINIKYLKNINKYYEFGDFILEEDLNSNLNLLIK